MPVNDWLFDAAPVTPELGDTLPDDVAELGAESRLRAREAPIAVEGQPADGNNGVDGEERLADGVGFEELVVAVVERKVRARLERVQLQAQGKDAHGIEHGAGEDRDHCQQVSSCNIGNDCSLRAHTFGDSTVGLYGPVEDPCYVVGPAAEHREECFEVGHGEEV